MKPPNPGKWILLLRDKAGMRVSLEGGNTPGAGSGKTEFSAAYKTNPGAYKRTRLKLFRLFYMSAKGGTPFI